MRRSVMAGCFAGLGLLTSCGSDVPGLMPDKDSEGVTVEAQRDVRLSETPLGDVITDDLVKGDEATALCFVPRARSGGGFIGSAVKIEAGGATGYAPVTDFPSDSAERRMTFDLDEDTLRTRLPDCSDSRSTAKVTELTCHGEAPVSEPYTHIDPNRGVASPEEAARMLVGANEPFSVVQRAEASAVAFVLRPEGTAYKRLGLVMFPNGAWHVEFVEACNPADLP